MNLIVFIVGLTTIAISIASYLFFRKREKPKSYEDRPAGDTKLMEIAVRELEAMLQRIISQMQATIWQAEFTASIGTCGIIIAAIALLV